MSKVDRTTALLLVVLVVGAGIVIADYGGLSLDLGGPVTTEDDSDTDTPPADGDPEQPRYQFRAKWLWDPPLGLSPPAWLNLQLHSAFGFLDHTDWMSSQNTWYTSVGGYSFRHNTEYLVVLETPEGWEFLFVEGDPVTVFGGGAAQQWRIMDSDGLRWAWLDFEWVTL